MGSDVTLAEMADYLNGYPFKPADMRSSGVPIVRIRQFLDPDASGDFSDMSLEERYRLTSGDVVFSWSATLACAEWDRGPAYLNQHLFKVVPREGFLPRFVMYAIQARLPQLGELAHGSTMRHIRVGDLSEVGVPRQTPEQQRRIVDLLSSADLMVVCAEDEHDASLVAAGQLIQEQYQTLCRAHGVRPLNEVATWSKGVKPATLLDEEVVGAARYLSTRSLRQGAGSWAVPDGRYVYCRREDLLLAWDGTAGEVFWGVEGIAASTMAVIRTTPGSSLGAVIELTLRSSSKKLKQTSRGSTIPHVDGAILAALPVPDVESRVAESVGQILASCDERVRLAEEKVKVSRHLRDQILHDLLSGTHTIPESYDRFLTEDAS